MSRRRTEKKKSRKKLVIGVVAVVLVLTLVFYYSSQQSLSPNAALVDHLSFFPEQRNQTFVEDAANLFRKGGLTSTYYDGDKTKVDFYRDLPSYGTDLMILRVHSAIMKTETGAIDKLGLFTSERYYNASDAYTKYPEDVENERLVIAFFNETERELGISYYGIVPEFIEESVRGDFEDAIIVMMGCEGLGYTNSITGARFNYTDMAKAFVNKGAKAYIGWNGLVTVSHTDQTTVRLLRNLILEKQTIGEAVEAVMKEIGPDPYFNSSLVYYPIEAGNSQVSGVVNSLTLSIIETNTVCFESQLLQVKSFRSIFARAQKPKAYPPLA